MTAPVTSESLRAELERAIRVEAVTPARNEADFIELTIKSVVMQTVRPIKWIIVSDGSTDGTDDIVQKYVTDYPWIELVRMPERRERHFAGKAFAFNAGRARLKTLSPDERKECLEKREEFFG